MRRLGAFCLVFLLAACGGAASPTPEAIDTPPTAPAAPTAAPTAAAPATAMPPSPTSVPTAAATPIVARVTYRVANTGGEGLFLRRAPSLGAEDRIRAWPEGTVFEGLGERREAAGVVWQRVRDPEGNVGYAAAQYLVAQEAGATPAAGTPTARAGG